MDKKFYLTSTLPYSNAAPHIGHTLEFIQADVVARYMRSKLGEENVWFNLGVDEHGLKMYKTALENNKTAQEYVDEFAGKWKEFCETFLVSYDTFYRTTDPSHHEAAKKWWLKSFEKGDIYKKKYTGQYCVGCEEFKTEKELVNGICPLHDKPTIEVSEENYFFKLSNYRKELIEWLDSNPEVLKPKRKLQELKNWIKNMEDISISREKKNLPWGIEVPNDPTQVMYVWFDALTDYINVLDQPENFQTDTFKKEKGIDKWWPGIQFFGPDNLRFQSAIWQAMLLSFDLPHTSKLLNHGMVLAADGTKMSKSKGNGVSPFDQIEKYPVEAIRYYLISGISTYSDSPYKEEDLVNLYNSKLANNFGNLLNRVIHLSNKLEVKINNEQLVQSEFKEEITNYKLQITSLFDEYELQEAVQKIEELSSFGNDYITQKAPWSKEISFEDAQTVLNNLSYLLNTLIQLYKPVIPTSAEKAEKMLMNKEAGVLFEKIELVS